MARCATAPTPTTRDTADPVGCRRDPPVGGPWTRISGRDGTRAGSSRGKPRACRCTYGGSTRHSPRARTIGVRCVNYARARCIFYWRRAGRGEVDRFRCGGRGHPRRVGRGSSWGARGLGRRGTARRRRRCRWRCRRRRRWGRRGAAARRRVRCRQRGGVQTWRARERKISQTD